MRVSPVPVVYKPGSSRSPAAVRGREIRRIGGSSRWVRTPINKAPDPVGTVVGSLRRHEDEPVAMLESLGALWVAGCSVAWDQVYPTRRTAVALPSYPWQRQRYWIDPPADGERSSFATGKRHDVADWFYLPSWKPSVRPRASATIAGEEWLLFLDDLGAGAALATELRARGARVATVTAGDAYRRDGDELTIDPRRGEHYRDLIDDLCSAERTPQHIVHLWSLTAPDDAPPRRKKEDA